MKPGEQIESTFGLSMVSVPINGTPATHDSQGADAVIRTAGR